jgi:hypothetical protein
MLSSFLTESLTTMDYVYKIIMLLGGVGAFLLGFKILSDNIEKLAKRFKDGFTVNESINRKE